MADNQSKEDKRTLEINAKIYSDRLKMLRKAQEYSQNDDIPKAVECYGQYLNALATYFKVDEDKLAPELFNQETDLAELLLISHVYWDLAKSYDRSPRLAMESIRCLDQFAKFTVGYKYQYANARMLKAFIRKKLAHNPKAFKQTYERIQIESKGCFIATDLYGQNNVVTIDLRIFKEEKLNQSKLGRLFIETYYQKLCPLYFKYIQQRTLLRSFTKKLIGLFHRLCR